MAGGAAGATSGATSRWRRSTSCAGSSAIDRRVSDDELWEVLGAFGPLLETQLAGATPADLRDSGLVDAQRGFADSPRPCSRCSSPPTPRPARRHARGYYDERRRDRVRGGRHRPPHLRARAGRHRALPRHAPRRHRGDGDDPAAGRGRHHGGRRPPPPRPRPPPRTRRPARSTSCSPSSTPSWASPA